eukprot:15328359-Ditylum_brightwellii.AAC.1
MTVALTRKSVNNAPSTGEGDVNRCHAEEGRMENEDSFRPLDPSSVFSTEEEHVLFPRERDISTHPQYHTNRILKWLAECCVYL